MNLKQDLGLAYRVSRFRFWFYLTGPFTVGCIYGTSRYLDLLNIQFFVYLFYFLIPANILLYGVNDYWDYDTDLMNPKKDKKEYRLKKDEKHRLGRIIKTVILISLTPLLLMRSHGEIILFVFFLLLSYFYSAKPLRFKERPILDSLSNILYLLPGIFSYYWLAGKLPPYIILVAGFFHSFAMHLFSAIPDIDYDRQTGIKTTAVLLGEKISLIVCLFAWTGLAAITILVGGNSVFKYLPLIYPIMIINVLLRELAVESVYWYYPYINIGFGGLMFLLQAIKTPWT